MPPVQYSQADQWPVQVLAQLFLDQFSGPLAPLWPPSLSLPQNDTLSYIVRLMSGIGCFFEARECLIWRFASKRPASVLNQPCKAQGPHTDPLPACFALPEAADIQLRDTPYRTKNGAGIKDEKEKHSARNQYA